MQFRIYDRQTLAYKDGGYVASYTIDDDYVVNNNSTINIIKGLNDKVVTGDTVVLIKTSGAYHKGIITTFDNADLTITYKSDKELFNDNMLNPYASFFSDESNDGIEVAGRFGIEYVANLIDAYFGKSSDWLRQLPIKVAVDGDVVDIGISLKLIIRTSGETPLSIASYNKSKLKSKLPKLDDSVVYFNYNGNSWEYDTNNIILEDYGIVLGGIAKSGDAIAISYTPAMMWTWQDNTINIADWLVELFKSYNLSLSWTINFDIANKIYARLDVDGKLETDVDGNIIVVNEREPYYIVTLSAITNSGKVIKDNVEMQTITYTENKSPDATVCAVLNDSDKQIYKMNSGKNLLDPYKITENKFLYVNQTYVYEQKKDDTTSNISGFISLESVGENTKSYYTLSGVNYDNQERNILFYNKDKKLISWTKNGETYYKVSYTKLPYTFYYTASDVKYCKICYDKNATNVQFEKGSTATTFEGYDISAIYYLCEKDGNYYVSLNPNEKDENGLSLRIMPSKFTTATYDASSDDVKTTPQEVAEETLIPSKFNQAIEIQISADSKMFDFENAYFGDLYKIVNEYGIIESNYTGRKEDSTSKWVTLYFGLGRQNYTDLIQMRMRKNKYKAVYK